MRLGDGLGMGLSPEEEPAFEDAYNFRGFPAVVKWSERLEIRSWTAYDLRDRSDAISWASGRLRRASESACPYEGRWAFEPRLLGRSGRRQDRAAEVG